jgi:hypothetical protein
VRVSTGGKICTFKFTSNEELVKKAAKQKMNELEVRFKPMPFDIGLKNFGMALVTGVFTAAPSSDVWFCSADWSKGGERATRNRKMNAKAAELGLEYYKIKKKPSLLELVFEIECQTRTKDILDGIGVTLVERLPGILKQITPFGCCDIGGFDFQVRLESNFLTMSHVQVMANLWPPAYPRLGACFDKLHPLVFGDKELCQNLAKAVGSGARLINSKGEELAAVRISSGCDLLAASQRAKKWLLLDAN